MELTEESVLGSDQIERLQPHLKLVQLNYYTCENYSDSIADVEFGITNKMIIKRLNIKKNQACLLDAI